MLLLFQQEGKFLSIRNNESDRLNAWNKNKTNEFSFIGTSYGRNTLTVFRRMNRANLRRGTLTVPFQFNTLFLRRNSSRQCSPAAFLINRTRYLFVSEMKLPCTEERVKLKFTKLWNSFVSNIRQNDSFWITKTHLLFQLRWTV